jgi:Double-GTPase 2
VADLEVEPEEIEGGVCSREGCPANDGGACAIGNENPLDCQFYELAEVDDAAPEVVAPPPRLLPAGEALRADQLEEILSEHPASFAVPLGLVGAGKTTLMCLLFDEVRTRRAPGWKFTRSRTVLGFARRGHDASFGSGRTIGKTPRTAFGASGLHLHLGMRREADDTRAPLVFVDLAGEHVRQFSDGKAVDVVVDSLRRADHVPIVVNGRHIADPRKRQRAIYQARALIGKIEQQDLREHATVFVVITKGDLLVDVDAKKVFEEITVGTTLAEAPRIVTADRQSAEVDGESAVVRGAGVHDLLILLTTLPEPEPIRWPPAAPTGGSPFLQRAWGNR